MAFLAIVFAPSISWFPASTGRRARPTPLTRSSSTAPPLRPIARTVRSSTRRLRRRSDRGPLETAAPLQQFLRGRLVLPEVRIRHALFYGRELFSGAGASKMVRDRWRGAPGPVLRSVRRGLWPCLRSYYLVSFSTVLRLEVRPPLSLLTTRSAMTVTPSDSQATRSPTPGCRLCGRLQESQILYEDGGLEQPSCSRIRPYGSTTADARVGRRARYAPLRSRASLPGPSADTRPTTAVHGRW